MKIRKIRMLNKSGGDSGRGRARASGEPARGGGGPGGGPAGRPAAAAGQLRPRHTVQPALPDL